MTTTLPILYTFRRCPYAMRARMALYTAKILHEHREVDLKNKPRQMLEISPKGTVPVLQLEDGTVLEQSLDIMKWALKITTLSLENESLISENDTTFKQALDRYKYPGRYSEEAGGNYRDYCEGFLKTIEARLNPFLTGKEVDLVDMALFPFIRQFVKVDLQWFAAQNYPSITTWLQLFSSSELFQNIMQNFPVWLPGDKTIEIKFSNIGA